VGPSLRPGEPVIVYAGDDTTDEAAFAALREGGVTIRVGGGESGAEYTVSGVRQVHALLRWIARALG
jgi:trehalose-6-phosphatase